MKEKRDPFDFWYAVNNTEIVSMPTGHLETFGTTVLNYYLVTELMDTVDRTCVREGRIYAARPKIITPEAYSQTVLEGFGEEAHKYIDWLKEHEKDIRVLQYGYSLRKEHFSEHIVTENLKKVLESVQARVKEKNDPFSAILVGVDQPWDVCLVKLFWEVIRASASVNIREMEQRRLFEDVGGVPRHVRNDIDSAFTAAKKDPTKIKLLAKKLQDLKLFEAYQDRFFALVKTSRSE